MLRSDTPEGGFIYELLKRFGRPLVAPSANPEGKPPARNVREAVEYFGTKVCYYVDTPSEGGKPSSLIDLRNRPNILREGSLSNTSIRKLLERIKQW
ncbi:MAG: Sua5/YciO/YrdC/YwlC family protein [Aquificota bacterium]|nr:Sua5/YciO/YrdC/YwlC family protein [Aquificota bacterium]